MRDFWGLACVIVLDWMFLDGSATFCSLIICRMSFARCRWNTTLASFEASNFELEVGKVT